MNEYTQKCKFSNIRFLYNNSFLFENKIICGSRGWNFPKSEEDKKIFSRELQRLQLSLEDGVNKYGNEKEIIVCTHYPPINLNNDTCILDILKKYNVKKCIYGHLHGESHKEAVQGLIDGIDFKLVSSDYLDFKLYKI